MSDIGFEKLLAEYDSQYMDSQAFSNWMPPDGTYLVVFTGVNHGVAEQDTGPALMWWRLNARIVEEGTHKDREFMAGYYTSKAFGFLKGATEALTGTPALNLKEAHEALYAAIGKVGEIEVETNYSKKYGRNITNTSILKIVPTEPIGQEMTANQA